MDECYLVVDNESEKVSCLNSEQISNLLGLDKKVWKKKVNSGSEVTTDDNKKVIICSIKKDPTLLETLANNSFKAGMFVYLMLSIVLLLKEESGSKIVAFIAIGLLALSFILSIISTKDY